MCYRNSCVYLYNITSLFAYLGLNSFREQASGRWKAKGRQEHFSDLPRHLPNSPLHQAPKAQAVRTLLHPNTIRWDGAQAPGSLRLSQWDFYPRVPTIVQPFLKFTADESPAIFWPYRAPLIKIPASSMWKPLWDLPQMKGEQEGVFLQGLFGILSQSQTDVCKIWTGYTTVLNSCSCAQQATSSGEMSTALF